MSAGAVAFVASQQPILVGALALLLVALALALPAGRVLAWQIASRCDLPMAVSRPARAKRMTATVRVFLT
ncbi:hypothetical protein WT24_24965 [Burkholderia sp. MSMB1078WGS]|uniref:hypothetical protein n=1 Tax=Burkholderia sp. MSMB1078WGS TaxID=1637900 RepID=UPI00075A9A6E|nr:hypothetical protein [Burkholderia sp. MSMB1078WGS]KVT04283.1 hypothetical protein WT24_24965 [Burkholderia sp. MSMB1078WGS]